MANVKFSAALACLALIAWYVLNAQYVNYRRRQKAHQWGCQPAFVRPHRWPFGLDILKRYSDMADQQEGQNDDLVLFAELGERHTWFQLLAGMWHHVTADPKNIQAMLATQFHDFGLGPVRKGAFSPLLGEEGIFVSDGKEWEHGRAILRPQFTRSQVSDLELEETHVQHFFKRLPTKSGWTEKVDLGPLFFDLTLDSATEFLFGESINTQSARTSSVKPSGLDWSTFGESFDKANYEVLFRFRLLDFYWLYTSKALREGCKEVHKCVDYFVEKALSGEKPKGKENSYVFSYELVKSTRDPIELRSQLLNILLAGRDTTASTLGFVLYYLARYPAVFDKLRSNILRDFGTGTENISFESLKSCTYLQNILAEVQRLEPVVPENGRRCMRDTTLPRGGGPDGMSPIFIKKGEEVMYNIRMMHRRKDLWGEDAHEFKPERFQGLRYGWEYLPFNGGPRICIGQQFALTEVGYVVVRMLQRFDQIEPLDDSHLKHKMTATACPSQVLVRLHAAGG